MNSNLGNLNVKDIISSLVSAGILSLLMFVGNSTNIFAIDWKSAISFVVMAMITSLAKSLGTTSDGKFVGLVKIKE